MRAVLASCTSLINACCFVDQSTYLSLRLKQNTVNIMKSVYMLIFFFFGSVNKLSFKKGSLQTQRSVLDQTNISKIQIAKPNNKQI